MTVQSQTSFIGYDGPGSVFAIPFRFLADSDIRITKALVDGTSQTLVLTTDYTLVGARQQSGGQASLVVALVTGERIVIDRGNMQLTQLTDYRANDPFPEEAAEDIADRGIMLLQQGLLDGSARSLRLSPVDIDGAGTYQGNGNRIADIADAVDPTDVPNLAQVTGLIGPGSGPFLQAGAGAVIRTYQDKARDIVSAKDYGAAGSGAGNDGPEIAAAIAANGSVEFPPGEYENTDTAVSLPFAKTAIFAPGADISNSGTGTTVYDGITARFGYNPSGLSGWTGSAAYSYEGLALDLGGYGPRQFGSFGTPTALSGSVNIPSTSTIANHANGVAGYAKTESASTGAVAIYGEAQSEATSSLAWGLNTRSIDNGFATTVWGYECDINVDNVNTNVVGIEVTGGSSVEPTVSNAFRVGPINPFTSPKKRFQRGFFSDDAAALVGLELGAQQDLANTQSQEIKLFYRNGANARQQGLSVFVDGSGNLSFTGGGTGALVDFRANGGTGAGIRLNGDNLGFFNSFPVGKPTVTGAKGGNAALTSLITALTSLGLIIDTTT